MLNVLIISGLETTGAVPYHKLFSFADFIDYVLMVVGTITAIGGGISMPLQTLIFGELIDTFGGITDNKAIVHAVPLVNHITLLMLVF